MSTAASTFVIAERPPVSPIEELAAPRPVSPIGPDRFEVRLAGGGRTVLALHRPSSEVPFPPEAVLRGLERSAPPFAVEWVSGRIEAAPLIVEMDFDASTAAALDDAEALREAFRSALGGQVYIRGEGFVNERGALVALESPVGLNGKRLVATFHRGRWVEYLLDTSNPSWRRRFAEGRLPRGMA